MVTTPSLRTELVEVARLVSEAALADDLELAVVAIGRSRVAVQHRRLQGGQVLARQVADEVGGREDGLRRRSAASDPEDPRMRSSLRGGRQLAVATGTAPPMGWLGVGDAIDDERPRAVGDHAREDLAADAERVERPGWSVPGTTSLPIVARMAGTGSPPPGARETAKAQPTPSGSVATQRMAWSPSPISTGPSSASPVCANDARRATRSAVSPVERAAGIRLVAGRDPALLELGIGRVGVGDEVPAELVERERSHHDLELGAERQEAGDDVPDRARALAHAQPVDARGDDLAGGEVGHGAEVGGRGRAWARRSASASGSATARATGSGTGVGRRRGRRRKDAAAPAAAAATGSGRAARIPHRAPG